MVQKEIMGMGNFLVQKKQGPKKDWKDMCCWGCGGTMHGWRECLTPRQGNNFPYKPVNRNLNGWQGEETKTSSPLPTMTREESTSKDN